MIGTTYQFSASSRKPFPEALRTKDGFTLYQIERDSNNSSKQIATVVYPLGTTPNNSEWSSYGWSPVTKS